jgi:hypothetical protein
MKILQFKQYTENLNEGFEFLTEASNPEAAKKAALMGPIHELAVSHHLNNQKFAEDHRAEGKRPEDVHHEYSKKVFGNNYKQTNAHKSVMDAAKGAATTLKKFMNVKGFHRVAWTSQQADHEKETGVKDPNSKADLVVTHKGSVKGGDHKTGKKVAISIKYQTEGARKNKPTNWSNHGKKSLESFSGADLNVGEKAEHKSLLDKHKVKNRDDYRALREKNPNVVKNIDESHAKMTAEVSRRFADGLRTKHHHKSQETQDSNLKQFVKKSVGGVGHKEGGNIESGHTHLPHVILKTTRKKDGTHTHEAHDVPSYVHNYLSHFHKLSVEHSPGQKGVKIVGFHKKTGKKMEVHRTQIYGDQSTAGFRTSTTLGSEGHKTIDHGKEIK